MAKRDENAGGYRSTDNSLHYDEFEADKHSATINSGGYNNGGGGDGDMNREVGKVAGGILGPVVVFVIVGYICWMALRQWAFYILPWIALILLWRSGAGKKTIGIGAVAALLVCLYGAFIYYPYVKEPSPFTADYVAAPSTMHSWRGFGRATELTEGEKVAVNGMSRDRKYLNITTPDGRSGWVAASAFPADAIRPADEMWKIIKSNINPFKGDRLRLHRDLWTANKYSLRDRDWVSIEDRVMRDYLGSEHAEGNQPSPRALTPRALRLTKGADVTVAGKWHNDFSDPLDVDVTLLNVVYAPEVTIVLLNMAVRDAMLDMVVDRSTTLTDLETGRSFPLLAWGDVGDQYALIFPATATRHFALSQMNEQMRKKYAKYNGVFWNFPEVRIGDMGARPVKAEMQTPLVGTATVIEPTAITGAPSWTAPDGETLPVGTILGVRGKQDGKWLPVRLEQDRDVWVKAKHVEIQ